MPAITLRLLDVAGVVHLIEYPFLSAILFGLGIVAAAFILSWAAEVAELDISAALALAFVALIAVLPEYAVDAYLTWQAGQEQLAGIPFADQEYVHYAAANMTGGNRLLVGLGWPLVALLFWFKRRQNLNLPEGLSLEILFLTIATIYSFTIPFKSNIALWDSAVLVGLFAVYMWLSSRSTHEDPILVGPSATIGLLPKLKRRAITLGMFFMAAFVILIAAEPFTEGLLVAGASAGIDEFILVQWVAPLASESPEILIAIIFTLRGMAGAAMTALISAKVNQWTLLVGTLPVVYSASVGEALPLPLDNRQAQEFFLTSAQSLFAVVLLLRLWISFRSSLILLLLFLAQLFSPIYPAIGFGIFNIQDRLFYAFVYIFLTALIIFVDRHRIIALVQCSSYVYKNLIKNKGEDN